MNLNASHVKKSGRRKFIGNLGIVAGALLTGAPGARAIRFEANRREMQDRMSVTSELNLSSIPNFCSHEHWGSIGSIGYIKDTGFRCDAVAGARPSTPTSIWDLLLDPYMGAIIQRSGLTADSAARQNGFNSMKDWWKADPSKALAVFKKLSASIGMLGTYHSTCRGIENLYGTDIRNFDLERWISVDKEIEKRYSSLFEWHQEAMKKNNLSKLIRPVQPEFYLKEDTSESKKLELSFTDTILRIDPLLGMWKEKSARRDSLAEFTGTDPADAKSWRTFITEVFDLAAQNRATGIKQLQAYNRTLDFQPRSDGEVKFRGTLTPGEITIFQDWVVHECCKQASDRRWPHQVHVGTNNLRESGPLPLEDLSKRYPQMNIVMLHCWPFLREAGQLARNFPNLYIDTCWLPVLNPGFLGEALDLWLNYVPSHKIMMAHDSTSIEMAVGSSLFTREILAEKLARQKSVLPGGDMRSLALDLLHNNAVRMYRIGNEV